MEPGIPGWEVLSLILGAAFMINVAWRLGERMLGIHNVPKEHEAWIEEVRRTLAALVEADIDKHNIEARLAHLLGKQPPGYAGLAREAFARILLIHPALSAKAEETGVFAKGTFASMGAPPYETFNPVTDLQRMPHLRVVHDDAAEPAKRGPYADPEVEPPMSFVGTVPIPRGPQ